MADSTVMDGWRCEARDDGRHAILESDPDVHLEMMADGSLDVTDYCRYYPSGSYRIPASVLRWLLGDTPNHIGTMVVNGGGVGIKL